MGDVSHTLQITLLGKSYYLLQDFSGLKEETQRRKKQERTIFLPFTSEALCGDDFLILMPIFSLQIMENSILPVLGMHPLLYTPPGHLFIVNREGIKM